MYRPLTDSRALSESAPTTLWTSSCGSIRKNFSWVDLIFEDGARVHFRRVSRGSDVESTRLEFEGIDQGAFYSSTLGWNGHGWDLIGPDGWVFVFSAVAGAKHGQQLAALFGIHDGSEHAFTLKRDVQGDLVYVRTPGGNSLDLDYDPARRVVFARTGDGRWVRYAYDAPGRLIRVEDSNGRIGQYTYDSEDRMVTVRDRTGHVLIANEYDSQGCLFRQTLTDGRALTYSCARASDGSLQTTTFRDPAGALTHFSYDKGFYLQSLPEIALDRTEVSPE